MNSWRRILLAAASLLILQSAMMAQKPKADYALTTNNCFNGDSYHDYVGEVSICGVIVGSGLVNSYWPYDSGWMMWKIPDGYDKFTCLVGVDDKDNQGSNNAVHCTLSIDLDGEPYPTTFNITAGMKPQKIEVPLSGAKTIRVNFKQARIGWNIVAPRLTTSTYIQPPPPGPNENQLQDGPRIAPNGSGSTIGHVAPTGSPDPPAVEPKDLDRLASILWKKAEANSALKNRIATSQIALATFLLVDIGSKSVAVNVTEDLSTSMIDAGFRLVERGQLDKVMTEFKIQNTGVMDPRTIQKIGQLAGCDLIVVGSISDRGQFLVVNCRMLETQTGKSLIAGQVEMRKTTLNR